MTGTGTLAVQVAVRLKDGRSLTSVVREVARLNKVSYGRVRFAAQHVADATCDPQLERLAAQYTERN